MTEPTPDQWRQVRRTIIDNITEMVPEWQHEPYIILRLGMALAAALEQIPKFNWPEEKKMNGVGRQKRRIQPAVKRR